MSPYFEAGKVTKDARPTEELPIPVGMKVKPFTDCSDTCWDVFVCRRWCFVFLLVFGFGTKFSGMFII